MLHFPFEDQIAKTSYKSFQPQTLMWVWAAEKQALRPVHKEPVIWLLLKQFILKK